MPSWVEKKAASPAKRGRTPRGGLAQGRRWQGSLSLRGGGLPAHHTLALADDAQAVQSSPQQHQAQQQAPPQQQLLPPSRGDGAAWARSCRLGRRVHRNADYTCDASRRARAGSRSRVDLVCSLRTPLRPPLSLPAHLARSTKVGAPAPLARCSLTVTHLLSSAATRRQSGQPRLGTSSAQGVPGTHALASAASAFLLSSDRR